MKSLLALALLSVVIVGLIGNAYAGGPSLKMQKDWGYDSEKFGCWYQASVLVERPNGEYACVYPHTAVKTNWEVVINSSNSNFMETKVGNHNIFAHFSRGIVSHSMALSDDNSLIVDLSAKSDGTMSVAIPHALMSTQTDNCLKPIPDDPYYVLVDDVEVFFDQRISNDTIRYLEIPYASSVNQIEIIGSCPI